MCTNGAVLVHYINWGDRLGTDAKKAVNRGVRAYPHIIITEKNGAGNGVRTRDPQLGKLMLYQLSYARMSYCVT